MEPAEGPPRFKRPADFSASPLCPGVPLAQERLQGPSKELWLIRAPASFSPESLNGHAVPLLGFQTLKASQPDGAKKIFHVQTTLEHLGGAQLLLPLGHGDHLTCSPPFSSSLSICEKYRGPSNSLSLFPVVARPAPQIPEGLQQRFLPFGNRPEGSRAAEEPPRKKKKKKTKKHRLGKEDCEEEVALFGTVWGVAPGTGKAEARQQHGAALLTNGSQPSSAAFAQDDLLSGEVEAAGPRKKKKKKKKRKEGELRGTEEAEAKRWQEGGAATRAGSFPEAQPDSAAFAQDGQGEAAGPGRKKRKEAGELEDKSRGEAEAAPPLENGTTPWAASSRPSSDPAAPDSFLSSKAKNLDHRSKKKKKKRDREVKDKRGEAEEGLLAASLCVGGGDSEPQAGQGSLPGMEEMTQHTHKGKRKEEAAAGARWDLSGLGASHEEVLVQEEPGVGSSGRKAKEKEHPEEGAQDLGGRPALLEVESWAQLGTPLWGGGRQAAEPAMELLSRKPKKKKRPKQEEQG